MPPTPKNLPALIRKPVTAGAFPSGSYFTPQPLATAAAPGQGTSKYPPSAPPVITRPPAISQPVTPRVGSVTNPAAPVAPAAPAAPDISRQASGIVQSQIQPIIDEINRSIAARSASGTAAIGGYTNALASLLAQQAATSGAPYQQAQAQQAGADAALAQRLSGAGTSLGDELRTKLMQADAGKTVTDQAAGSVTGTGQGASNASYATGNASLSDLIARGAAARTYGESLPGIARLSGLQQTGQYQGQLATDLTNQLGQVQSKVPGLVSDVTSSLTASQDKRYAADQAAADRAATRADANARSAATIKAQNARAAATTSLNAWKAEQAVKSQQVKDALSAAKADLDARIKTWQTSGVDPVTGLRSQKAIQADQAHLDKLTSIQAQNDRTAAGIGAANSRAAAGISASWDRLQAQLDAKTKTNEKKLLGGFTPQQRAVLDGRAYSLAFAAKNGIPESTDERGNTLPAHPPISYQEAIAEAKKAGIPASVFQPALDELYKPGEQGRPAASGAAKAVATARSRFDSLNTLTGTRVEVPGSASPFAKAVLGEAQSWLGTPYSWGGGGPSGPSYGIGRGAKTKGFDCSSFAQYLYGKAGVSIPRTTYEQFKVGTPVGRDQLEPGDLVFFHPGPRGPEHEGIYVGDDKFMHAPKTGDVVKVSSLAGSYAESFAGGRRIRNG